ncbi:hypothetical protein IQ243_28505 [Nostocales cyanobacterium LEGE 11386]|nr:hypothetical protein [Nostocales cyanobacterium LEGE 11386]
MSLPQEFEPVIKEDFGDYGWALANCFSFTSEFLGYQALDISSFETALKAISNFHGSSLTNYAYPNNLTTYLKEYYPQVHQILIRKAKRLKLSNEDEESERQETVAEKFAQYTLNQGIELVAYLIPPFYKNFIINTLFSEIYDCFSEIEEAINKTEVTDQER